MSSFQHATAVTRAEGGYAAILDPAWEIWGPAGGYVAAIALRAVGLAAPAGHRPATLAGQFIGRASAGPVAVVVEPLKAGASALWRVALEQSGRSFFVAHLWTTTRRDPVEVIAPNMPAVPPPEDLPEFTALLAERGIAAIPFWCHFDARPIDFRLHSDPMIIDGRLRRWFRFQGWEATTDPFLEGARAALLLDVHVWPAHHLRLSRQPAYAAPSLDVTLAFHTDAPGGDWLLLDMNADVAGDGLLHGHGRVWSRDGRALASGGGQCLAVASRG